MPNWKKVIVSGSDASLNSLNVINGITGSLLGTSSYALNADLLDGLNSTTFATTGSNTFIGNQTVTGSLSVSQSLAVGNVTASAVSGRIDATNDVVAFSTSDKRLKENIQPIENALDKLDNIGGYTFDWNNQIEIHGYKGHDIGVIAQEIEEILPEIVTTRDNGYKAVKYEKIVPLLIQAIKELQQEINELKASK